MANACKQDARGIGKAQAGKCWACARKGHAQVRAWFAQARKHTRTQRVLLTLVFGDVCGGAGSVWNMRSAQSSVQKDCVWITRGVAFQHRLAACSSSTALVFGSEHTGRLCCSSQQASLLVAGCALVVGVNVVGVHASQ